MISFIKPLLVAAVFFSVVMGQAVSGRFQLIGPAGERAQINPLDSSPANITMKSHSSSHKFDVWEFLLVRDRQKDVIVNVGAGVPVGLVNRDGVSGEPVQIGLRPVDWNVTHIANENYTIRLAANPNLVWTVVTPIPGQPGQIVLKEESSSSSQTFTFQPEKVLLVQ